MNKMKNVYFETVKCTVCGKEVKKSSATNGLYEMDFLGDGSARHYCNRDRKK